MRIAVFTTLVVILLLQYALWFGQSGHFAQARLVHKVEAQEQQVAEIRSRNQLLVAEIMALKGDRRALEARARTRLGMVKRGEVFYLVPGTHTP